MRYIIWMIISICFIPLSLLAQGSGVTAVPFIVHGTSASLGGHIGVNSVLPTDDTFGFIYNPAQLGVFSRDNNFSSQFTLNEIKWFPGSTPDWYLRSKAFTTGYIVKDVFKEIDVNVGIGYMHTLFNLGKNVWIDDGGSIIGIYDAHETFDAFSVGFGFEYFARFSFGYTYKKINSNLGPKQIVVGNEFIDGRADATAHDFGMMVEIPIIKNHLRNFKGAVFIDENISLFSNAYLGFATTNIGDFISYDDDAQADPLPKKAKLGIGFSVGILQELDFAPLKLIEIEVGQEAQDYLVKRSGVNASYQSGFGDIDIGKHLWQGNSDDLVQVNTSVRINLAETVFIGIHKMKGPGFPAYVHNTAYTFTTRGVFKFIAGSENDDFLNDIFSHVELRYSQCSMNAPKESPLNGTSYKGITLALHGLFE